MAGVFVKSDIRRVTIALEKIHYHEVSLELGKAGFIHLCRPRDSAPGAMKDTGLRDEETKSREILSGIEYALNALHIEPGEAGIPGSTPDTGRDAAFVRATRLILERVQSLRSRIREESAILAGRRTSLEALNRMGIDPVTIQKARLAHMVFGTVEITDWIPPARGGFVLARAGGYVFGASLAPDLPRMARFLSGHGFIDRSGDLAGATREGLVHREETLRHRLGILDKYLEGLQVRTGQTLKTLHGVYSGYGEILGALRMALFSSKAMFLSGWMDIQDKPRLLTILKGICSDRFVAVVSDRRDPDAPVRLMNLRILRPFELLVKTMGMPANSEIDPTPLAAVTFVLMFGLMFGDLGQGLVLALAGFMLKRGAQKEGQPQGTRGQLGGMLIICGISAGVCGMLYGSVFSSEHIVPALWFHPMKHIMGLFAVTILMGALFIAAGLGVNIINCLLNADYSGAFLEKRGVAVLVLYASAVLMAARYAKNGQGPAPWETGVFIILPLVVFSLRGVLGPVLFHVPPPRSMAEYAVETVVDMLEIGITMLANTISFIRVGAFALSHAGLSIVTFTLAGMADPALKSLSAITIIIFGNIFIIGFEGLICGIQSMRLEYYEFFSKFFRGDGVAFTPFTLKAQIVGGAG